MLLNATKGAMLLLMIVVGVVIVVMILKRSTKESYDFTGDPCVDHCRIAHPEAARMYMDETNPIADDEMAGCIKRCRQASVNTITGGRKRCSSCA